ncbi:non-ribosomal peptide synthetase [Thalassomonas actiniarum]|uniref:Non-ribosomal peptide synthetase n=1 Tax=Thalassomonas actiniarum TaxID=485447 RepID=A0AAE9YWM9_9GAMM|nr:non-ribosomal peptide synthetase [Thalassomonas actiniarum]WDE02530.1 non-ribosomal peptide synthetase [Thalassomonas actiniarum]
MSVPQKVTQAVSRADVEQMLRDFMAKVLPSAPTQADMHIPFLEMGANSLALMEVQRAVESRYGLTITIPQFFQELTHAAALVDHIVENCRQAVDDTTGDPSGEVPAARIEANRAGDSVAPGATARDAAVLPMIAAAGEEELQVIFTRQLETASRTINRLVARQLALLAELDGGEQVSPAEAPGVTAQVKQPRTADKTADKVTAELGQSADKNSSSAVMHRMLSPLETRARGLTEQQSKHLESLIGAYTSKTRESKKLAARDRQALADSRASVGFRFTTKEMLYPVVGKRGQGAHLWDVDGNEYIDITMGQGVTLFGHHPEFIEQALADPENDPCLLGPRSAHAGEAAALACELTGMERATFTNSGTEAVMVAMRLARAATGRSKIVMFENAYHGHADNVMGRPVWQEETLTTVPVAPGIPQAAVDDIWILEYGSDSALDFIRAHGGQIAAVMVEPVQSRRPDLQPREFLHQLRSITEQSASLLVFDEMITGFRIHQGGAQAWFGVKADIATYGKVLAGGMPVGMVAGAARFMDAIDGGAWQYGDNSYPAADRTIFGGTFCQHPTTMITTLATLRYLKQQGPALQQQLNARTQYLAGELNNFFDEQSVPMRVIYFGSLFRFSFSGNFELLFYHMMEKGIFIWEWRNYFLSTAHTAEDIAKIIQAVKESVAALQHGGFINPPDRDTDLPAPMALSQAQQQLLTLARILPEGSKAYHVSPLLQLQGQLQPAVLQLAVREVMRRHQALRARIVDDQLQIMPLEQLTAAGMTSTDLSGHPDPESALEQLLAGHADQAFDLSRGPLFEVHLFCLAQTEHRLLIKAHHIVTDGLSVNLIVRELATIYSAALQAQDHKLPRPLPLGDYLHWQQNASFEKQKAYWLEQLAGELPVLDLPVDRPEPVTKSYRGGRYRQLIAAPLLAKIRTLSRTAGCTDFMTLFCAYALWLHRLCQQDDVLIGIPVAGRSLPEGEQLVAYATHLIPVRSRVQWQQSFSDYLQVMRDTLLAGYENQDYPFARLLDEPALKGRRGSLISAVFNLDRPGQAPEMAGMQVKWLSQSLHYTAFALTLNLTEVDDEMVLECDFSRDLFDEASIAAYVAGLFALFESIVDDPGQALEKIPLLDQAARQQLLVDWNDTAADYPDNLCLSQLFEARVADTPEAIALKEGETQISYTELNRRANRLVLWLKNQGVGPNVVVAVCLERSAELVVSLLAVMKAGGAYLPLDPAYPTQRLTFMLEDAGVALLLTQHSLVARFDGLTGLETLCLDTQQALFAGNSDNNPDISLSPENLAYLIYTSGSTGQPKGTLIAQRSLVNYLAWAGQYYQAAQGDGAPLHSSISFDATLTSLFLPLLSGRELVLLSEGGQEIDHICTALTSETCWSFVKLTPAHLDLVNAMVEGQSLAQQTRCLVLGGEALLESQLGNWHQYAPQTRLVNEYGPTETVVGCCIYQADGDRVSGNSAGTVPIGRPIANTQLYVLDQNRQPVPVGVKGELYIGGDGVALGYHNRPELSAERFLTLAQTGLKDLLPAMADKRLYRTGDIVRYLPDGNLVYLGRCDNQVKVRGFRIELAEIETGLTRQAQIREAVVIAKQHSRQDVRLIAYIVAENADTFDEQVLRMALADALPAHMLPGAFVLLDALPLTAHGKVDRTALPPPDTLRAQLTPAFAHPGNEAEKKIAALWCELLNIEQPGINDSFFELGGHSLLVIPLRDRLQATFGKPLLPVDILRLPTIAAQARFMTQAPDKGRGQTQEIQQRASRQRQAFKKKKKRSQCA